MLWAGVILGGEQTPVSEILSKANKRRGYTIYSNGIGVEDSLADTPPCHQRFAERESKIG